MVNFNKKRGGGEGPYISSMRLSKSENNQGRFVSKSDIIESLMQITGGRFGKNEIK